MLSFSNSVTFLINEESASSFLAVYQLGSFPKTIITADITKPTAGGGDVKDFTSAIYYLSNIEIAYSAIKRAGSAFLSSASASAASAKVSSFSLSTLIDSA